HAAVRAEDLDPVEREVPLAAPLRDPDPRRDVAPRVPREELRDRAVDEVHVRCLVRLEPRLRDDAEVLRTRHRLHEMAEERVLGRPHRGREAVPRGPQVPRGLEAVEVREMDGTPWVLEQGAGARELAARALLDRDDLVGEPLEPLADRHPDTFARRRRGRALAVAAQEVRGDRGNSDGGVMPSAREFVRGTTLYEDFDGASLAGQVVDEAFRHGVV